MTEGEKKTERKNLTVTQVEAIKKVGDKQIPKLSFKAKDGDKESLYFTFKSSLFELTKEGQTINADVETSTRDWEGTTYTDRRVVQIYVEGQPVGGKKEQFYRGKSPEELEQSAKLMVLAYAKDLAVADKIKVVEIINQAGVFYNWIKKNGAPKAPEPKLETKESVPSEGKSPAPKSKAQDKPSVTKQPEPGIDETWEEIGKETASMPASKKIQNITELKGLMGKHKVGTREAYEILSIGSFMELIDLDQAWVDIKTAKKIDV